VARERAAGLYGAELWVGEGAGGGCGLNFEYMKSLAKISILIFVTVAAFSSCDPAYFFTERIDNNSSETIDFFMYSNTTQAPYDTFHIPAKSSLEVLNTSDRGSAYKIKCGSVFALDSFQVKTTHNKTLIKDVKNPDNWAFVTDERIATSEKHCVLTIEDSDLQ
jgi:hypothetical protein